jgi:peroxin-6
LHLTGADFYALCSDALLSAISEKIELVETGKRKLEEVENEAVMVEMRHFQLALGRLKPSVSIEELKHYKQLQSQFTQKK